MNRPVNLSLSIRVNEIDGDVHFDVTPPGQTKSHDNLKIFYWQPVIQDKFHISVNLWSRQGTQSHIVIEELKCNGTVLGNMDTWAKYIRFEDNVVRTTHGYMDHPGRYQLTVHQNALVHNYMTNFLGRCKPKNTD
jgi:hypothetical protein